MQEFLLSPDAKERLRDRKGLQSALDKGKSGQEIVGFSDEAMAKFYGAAYAIFEREEYEEAEDAFLFLATLNPNIYDHWLGLGMARQMGKKFEEAIDAYELAAIHQLDSPVPYFFLGKCFFAIHERDSALYALELAIEYAAEIPAYEELKSEALAAKEILLKE